MNQPSFVLTTLSANPEYFEEIISLIEREFHYDENQHYENDFALLMDPSNFENCYFYLEENTNSVAAHLATCKRIAVKKDAEMNVILVGAIATKTEFRGQNLFRNLLNHALSVHKQDTALFMLWSDITGLYEKFNFYLSGGLIESGNAQFSSDVRPAGFSRTKFSELSSDDFARIQYLYTSFNEKYFLTFQRQPREWSIIREMNSIDVYVKRNSENKIIQYFCINKGKDLGNVIHEIGCLPEYYIPLINSLKSFKLWLPETEISLVNNKDIFFTAFMKLGNKELLNTFLHSATADKLKIDELKDGNVNFIFNNQPHQCSEKDFIQFVFGPRPLKEFEEYHLSFYVTGTDSI